MDNQNSKVKSKEQLKQEIKRWKSILNKSTLSYLEHLIELDCSVVKNNISDEERLALSELEIYKDTAIYNIYHRAILLLEQSEIHQLIHEQTNGELMATIEVGNQSTNLFTFNFGKPFLEKIPKDCRSTQIGEIQLYQLVENAAARKCELERQTERLNNLLNASHPYLAYEYEGRYERSNLWKLEQNRKIEECRRKIKKLSVGVLTEEDKKAIEHTNYIHDLFMEDYGLMEEDFIEEKNKNLLVGREELQKVYVKNMPSLQIVRKVNNL